MYLADIAEIIMGQSPNGENCNSKGHGLPLLNGPTEFGPSHPTPVQFTTDPRKKSQNADLLFCVRGSTTGKMNWSNKPYAIGRGIAAIRDRRGPAFQPLLRAIIELSLPDLLQAATGSTFPNVSYRQLAELPFPVLSDESCLSLSSFFGALDDKIDLNRRTNEALEAMARALFRDWFVDFGPTRAKMAGQMPYLAPELWELFPNRLDDEAKPEGWETTSISSLCSITSGKRPPNKVSSPSIENPVPVYGGNGISWFTKDILFNERFLITGRVGTLGTVFRVSKECWVSDNALCLFPKINSLFEYAYFVLSDVDFQSLNGGSTQPLLTQTSLGAQQCILPQQALVNIFHEQVFLWFDRQSQIEKQNQSLAQLRDLLLPKLMSGEIRIRDAEKMVADAL